MKKKLSLLLAVFLLIGIISGCATNNTGNSAAGGDKTTAADGKANENNSEVQSGEKTVLDVIAVIHSWTKDLADLPMIQRSLEYANIDVNWNYVRSGWDEKKSVILASGDVPDVFLGWAINDNDIAAFPNLFVPLNELIEKHAPNVQTMFNETPDLKALATFSDGNIYSLPSLIPHRPSSFVTFSINKVWLDKLGLKAPKTFDEYYNVLKAFKEQDPNGNGLQDEIGLDWAPERGLFCGISFIGAYGNYTQDFSGDWLTVKDGKFIFLAETEDYKNLVSYLHKLYSEGLINQEVFTQDYSQIQARSKDPNYATVGSTLGWDIDDRFGPQWFDQYVILEPLAAKEGIKPLWPAHPMRVKTLTNTNHVTASNPDLVSTMKWLDYFYTEEMSAQGYYGSIGVTMDKDDDKYVLREPPEGTSAGEFKWQNALVDAGMMYVPKSLEDRIIDLPVNLARVEHDKVYVPYFPDDSNILPILKFTSEEASELSIIKTDIYKLVDMKWAEWISKGGVENEWDSYIKELNNMGLDTMKSIYQAKYDAYGK